MKMITSSKSNKRWFLLFALCVVTQGVRMSSRRLKRRLVAEVPKPQEHARARSTTVAVPPKPKLRQAYSDPGPRRPVPTNARPRRHSMSLPRKRGYNVGDIVLREGKPGKVLEVLGNGMLKVDFDTFNEGDDKAKSEEVSTRYLAKLSQKGVTKYRVDGMGYYLRKLNKHNAQEDSKGEFGHINYETMDMPSTPRKRRVSFMTSQPQIYKPAGPGYRRTCPERYFNQKQYPCPEYSWDELVEMGHSENQIKNNFGYSKQVIKEKTGRDLGHLLWYSEKYSDDTLLKMGFRPKAINKIRADLAERKKTSMSETLKRRLLAFVSANSTKRDT